MDPPVAESAAPLDKMTLPPLPLLPLPTVIEIKPDLPDRALPLPTNMIPELPAVETPELKMIKPDVPLAPAFAAAKNIDPLLVPV